MSDERAQEHFKRGHFEDDGTYVSPEGMRFPPPALEGAVYETHVEDRVGIFSKDTEPPIKYGPFSDGEFYTASQILAGEAPDD